MLLQSLVPALPLPTKKQEVPLKNRNNMLKQKHALPCWESKSIQKKLCSRQFLETIVIELLQRGHYKGLLQKSFSAPGHICTCSHMAKLYIAGKSWRSLEWLNTNQIKNLFKQPTALQAVWNSGVSPVLVQSAADSVVSWHLSTYWLPDAGAFECWTPLFVTLKGIWQLLPIFMWALVLCLRDNFPEQHVMWQMKREVQSPLLTVGLETRMGAREVQAQLKEGDPSTDP